VSRRRNVRSPLTSAAARRLDSLAVKRYGMPVLLLMENAGRSVALQARRALERSGRGPVIVLAGGGNNGGDGVVAARYLRGWGWPAQVWWLSNPNRWTDHLAVHYRMARKFGVGFRPFLSVPASRRVAELRKAPLLIDALLGTGFKGPLRLLAYDAIICLNHARRPVLSVDIPSGINADTGAASEAAVKARWTVTMAAPKKGLLTPRGKAYAGRVIVADIGFPAEAPR